MRLLYWLVFFPFQTSLLLLFMGNELVRLVGMALGFSPPIMDGPPIVDHRCSIIILNWNGRHLLEESLPAVERAVQFSGAEHEVIVVDNGSTDDSIDWIRDNHPGARIMALPENLGFGEGNNRGVEAARHEIVVLLNNDMVVSEDFLSPLMGPFSEPETFAVTSQILFPQNKRREETGNTRTHLEWGYGHFSHQPIRKHHYRRRYLPVAWAGGGSSAFHRKRFLELGGFSPLFSPCYVEDTDLSYRAWRRGWKILLAAHSQVLHKHRSSTSARFTPAALERLLEERKLWYLWKNFQLRKVAIHLLLLPVHFGHKLSPSTYLRALRKLGSVLAARLRAPRRRISEPLTRAWVDHPLLYLQHVQGQRKLPARPRLRILIVSAYLPRLGQHGGGNRVFCLLQEAARKHDLSLISFVESDREAADRTEVEALCKRTEIVYRSHYSPVSPFPYEPFEEFNSQEFRDRLEKVLTEEDFDLVHFEWPQMAQYADLTSHIPRLVTEIEVQYAAHYSQVPFESNLFLKARKLYNTLQTFYRELQMCRTVEQVVCVTDVDRNYLSGYLPKDRLSVINTGVDTEYFTTNGVPQPDPNSLVFVGAFRHQPNVDAMHYFCREIFPRVREERPETHLFIVGSSPPPSICELGSQPGITVTGYVEDIRPFYASAQVVVVPLRTGVGIRGKILEGWAAGKAMVATPLSCFGIRATHGENIMIARDSNEFGLWTLALLDNPDFCRQLGQRGRKTAERFYDWSLLGEEMIELYESLALREHHRTSHREAGRASR